MKSDSSQEAGFVHVVVILLIIAVLGFVGWRVYINKKNHAATQPSQSVGTEQKLPDSVSSIDSPQKIATSVGGQYFYYGAPAGQNNASPKKILITLHGTEGSAEKDYEIWKPYIKETQFALASLNWWDGSGDRTSDYSTPETINTQIHEFLVSQGYAKGDAIVLEGFSRGSANTYPIVAHDQVSATPMIDVAVSSSGGAQEDYFGLATATIAAKVQSNIFSSVYWVLACGNMDSNSSSDGCVAMEASKTFVSSRGATVLGILSDPNGGHGALTTSPLNLPKQMFELIEQKY